MVSEFLDRLSAIMGSRANLAKALGITTNTLRQWYHRQAIPEYGIDLMYHSKALPFVKHLSLAGCTYGHRYWTYRKALGKMFEFQETYKDQSTLIAELVADLPKYKDKLTVKNS